MAGCITKTGKNKYRIRISDGFYLDGRRKYNNITVTCTSKRQAELERDKYSAQLQSGCTYSATKTTLNEFSKQWLETYVKPNLSPTTYQSYNEKLNKHILPYLGSKRLDKIKPLDIDNLYNLLSTKLTNRKDENGNFKTLSPASIHRVHEILSSIFSTALRWGLIPYNPCTKVIQPKYRNTKMTCYDEETSKRLINGFRSSF